MSEITRGEIVRVVLTWPNVSFRALRVDEAGRTAATKALPHDKFTASCASAPAARARLPERLKVALPPSTPQR
jgi:hypothetical protein